MLIKDAARAAAESTLQAFYPDASFPVDPEYIARRMGLKVVRAPLADEVSGFIVKNQGKDAEIYLSESDGSTRQRFTCAHELGHYVERQSALPEPDDSFTFVDFRDGRTNDVHEFYANEFAGCLLMPREAVKSMSQDGLDEIRLAAVFGVSVAAARIRLRRLGLS